MARGRLTHTCDRCGSRRAPILSTCPGDITCPTCGAGPGKPCTAGPGHIAYFMHGDRLRAAEEYDRTRGAPGESRLEGASE